MKVKRKLFVRYFHESNIDLLLIDDLPLRGCLGTPTYQTESLGYISKRNVSKCSSGRLALIRLNLSRRSCNQLPSNEDKAAQDTSPNILKPNFFSFLEKKLVTENLSSKAVNRIQDNADTVNPCSVERIRKSESRTDFLSWLEGKLEDKSTDSSDALDGYSPIEDKLLHNSDNICELCGKSYTSKNGLAYHMVLHSGIYPYQCDQCCKSFKSSSTLHRHIRSVHEKQKPFECKECHKTFLQKSNLKKHLDSHYGIRRFKCYICFKEFLQKCHLNNHLITHSQKKHFKCDICAQSFAKQYCLDRHLKNIHHV